MLGYRVGEVPSKAIGKTKDITITRRYLNLTRVAYMRCLGMWVSGMCLPTPDRNDEVTLVHGLKCRIGRTHGDVDKKMLRALRSFVRLWIRRNLTPLTDSEILTFDEWIEGTLYPEWRKEELREVYYNHFDEFPRGKYKKMKCFNKAEQYSEYKPIRGIFSRHDYYKCWIGPLMKSIEIKIYEHPSFIKHVPVSERPRYVFDRLHLGKIIATDYSAFESSFTPEIMRAVECQLYQYMVPQQSAKIRRFCDDITGVNTCEFKGCRLKVQACRMSGEMNTSLGNGFTNLMIMLFLCNRLGSKVDGVVEGDDGLFSVQGQIPKSDNYAALGFSIKLEEVNELSEASFCGFVADPIELENVRDPVKTFVKLGWTLSPRRNGKSRVLKGLLRAKAFSLLHELPHCPILTKLALRVIDLTEGIKALYDFDWWEEQLKSFPLVTDGRVGIRTRLLVERKYGLSVSNQLECENDLDSWSLGELPDSFTKAAMNHPDSSNWIDYFQRYRWFV